MENYKSKLSGLADKIKSEVPQTPLQEVQPVKAQIVPAPEEESRFNNWIPKGLKRKIKAYGVQHDMSQKDITIAALQEFLRAKGINPDQR